MKFGRWSTYLFLFIFSLAILALALYQSIPDVSALRGCLKTQMYSYYLCKSSPDYVPLSQISPYVVKAIIVSEDGGFYDHNGFDWHEIKQTVHKNINVMGYARGGSTITQQLAKNVFLTKEKSLIRKIREAIITVQLEKKFSKNQILESYLNVVEFAPRVYGVKSAARHYFDKSPTDLDILEAAFLAFLLPNPERHRQSFVVKNLTAYARKRLARIVGLMAKYHKISQDEKDTALGRLGGAQWLDQPFEMEDYFDEAGGVQESTDDSALQPTPDLDSEESDSNSEN